MNRIPLTLCIIRDNGKVLLGMKKQGFGEGRWNGFGGQIVEGEDIEEAAARVVREETGVDVRNLIGKGVLEFEFQDVPDIHEIYVFETTEFEGDPVETDEMRPDWFSEQDLPFEDMWPDDRHWMPLLLAGKKFVGKFSFNKEGELLNWNLKEVKEEQDAEKKHADL